MSWRFISVVLLIAIGVSAWGGIHLGDWLIAHGPEKVAYQNKATLPKVPVLDANGLPYVAQPPQPLVDGHFGVPNPPQSTDWKITTTQSAAEVPNLNIALATTTITMDEAELIASNSQGGTQGGNLVGIADVSNLGLGGKPATPPLQPVDVPPPPPPPRQSPTPDGNWQAEFQRALKICSQKGFFDRPSCSWDARNQYCEPNNAWGKVPDCPAKTF